MHSEMGQKTGTKLISHYSFFVKWVHKKRCEFFQFISDVPVLCFKGSKCLSILYS
jgi:hypothetical protein